MDGYVTKPIQPAALAAAIERWLPGDCRAEPARGEAVPAPVDLVAARRLAGGDEALRAEVAATFVEGCRQYQAELRDAVAVGRRCANRADRPHAEGRGGGRRRHDGPGTRRRAGGAQPGRLRRPRGRPLRGARAGARPSPGVPGCGSRTVATVPRLTPSKRYCRGRRSIAPRRTPSLQSVDGTDSAATGPRAARFDILHGTGLECSSVAMKHPADRPWLVRAALLALLALVVFSTEIPEIHNHDAGTPGLYSEDCPLARLAIPSWGLPALARPILFRPEAFPDPGPPRADTSPSEAARCPFAPRAPPATA